MYNQKKPYISIWNWINKYPPKIYQKGEFEIIFGVRNYGGLNRIHLSGFGLSSIDQKPKNI